MTDAEIREQLSAQLEAEAKPASNYARAFRMVLAADEMLRALKDCYEGWRHGEDVVGPMRRAKALIDEIES